MNGRKTLGATAGPVCIAPGMMHGGRSQTESKGKTGISWRRLNNSVNLAHEKSFEVRFKDPGRDVINTNAVDGLGKQISDIDALMTRGVKGLITFPIDKKAIGPLVQRAKTVGIPAIGRAINIENCDACMNHPADSWRMGETVCENLMPVAKIEKTWYITGNFSNFAGHCRYYSFIDYMKKQYPNIEVFLDQAKLGGGLEVVDAMRKGGVDITIVADDVACGIFRLVYDSRTRWSRAKNWTNGLRFEYRKSQWRTVGYSGGIGGDERRH